MLAMSKQLSSEEFAVRYSACHLELLRYVLTLLPNRPLAEDVVQEVARLLWQKRHEYDPAKPFWPWARAFARYEVLIAIRRQNVRGKYFSEQLIEQLAEERVAHEEHLAAQREALAECLQKLDKPSRELLMSRYGREVTVQQLAQQQGKSANALYLALHRLRQTLSDCVNRTLRIERGV
jgi:RNA polymerase sigma-70 factor (ECF subfamily)